MERITVNKRVFPGAATLFLLIQSIYASTDSRQATITGGGGWNGRCTIEVNVDGAAEVEISGGTGLLRTISGQTAFWRRFQCNAPLPRNPNDFRFTGIDGRGTVRLLREPRGNGGTALIHINDPKGGRGVYTFDLQWRGSGGGWPPAPPPLPPGRGPGPRPSPSSAIQSCRDSVTNRLNRDGYPYVAFERTIPDNGPGRHDWVTGTVTGKRRFETARFAFSCSVDLSSGRVRRVERRG